MHCNVIFILQGKVTCIAFMHNASCYGVLGVHAIVCNYVLLCSKKCNMCAKAQQADKR